MNSGAPGQDPWTPSQGALDATDMGAASSVACSGFWRRFGALLIDYLLIWFVSMILVVALRVAGGISGEPASAATALTGLAAAAIWLLGPWLYFAIMESSGLQGTLGKLAVGVKVTDLAGQRIGFGRATGRFWGKVISTVILYIGFIMAAFTARKQALHDMMAGTLVVHRNPGPQALAAGAAGRSMPGWAIALIILGCAVPFLGVLAAIAIPAYADYTLRAQVSEGLTLAQEPRRQVADALAASPDPVAYVMATMQMESLSGTYVASVGLEAGAIVIEYGNQAHQNLAGQTFALVPGRNEAGKIIWICGHQKAPAGVDLGNPDPGGLTSLPPKYLPGSCRP